MQYLSLEEFRAKASEVEEIPLLPSDACVVKEFAGALTVDAVDAAARIAKFVFSTEYKDRHGDVILVSGWDTAAYLTNPVVLDTHDSSSIDKILGRTIKLEKTGSALVGTIEFLAEGINSAADRAFWLVQNGFLNTVSVGFKPLKYAPSKNTQSGMVFSAQELLEVSLVSIPSNPEALYQAKAAGFDILGFTDMGGLKEMGLEPIKPIVPIAPIVPHKLKNFWTISMLAQLVHDGMFLLDGAPTSWAPGYADISTGLNLLGQALVAMTVAEVEELMEVSAETEQLAPTAQKSTVDFFMMAKNDPHAAATLVRTFAEHAAGGEITFNSKKAIEVKLRAGRTLSAANEAGLTEAYDVILAGCAKIKKIIGAEEVAVAEDTISVTTIDEIAARAARVAKAMAYSAGV